MKKSLALLLAVAVMLSAATFSACDSSTFYIDVTSEISGETYRINRMEQKKAYFAGGMGIHFTRNFRPSRLPENLKARRKRSKHTETSCFLRMTLAEGKRIFS